MSLRCIIQFINEVFVSTVICDFVQHFWQLVLVSQFVIFRVISVWFRHLYIRPFAVVTFCLFSMFLVCPLFL